MARRSSQQRSSSSAAVEVVNRILIVCVLVAASVLSFGQAKPEAVEQILKQLERDWTQASLKKDIAALDKIMADDWVSIDFQGKAVTKAETLANLKAGLPATQAAGIGEMKVRIFGDSAIVTGSDTEKSTLQGKDVIDKYLWTDVFVKRDGRWQAVASQSTKVAR
jgi:ketosteroid isomerase-like protein